MKSLLFSALMVLLITTGCDDSSSDKKSFDCTVCDTNYQTCDEDAKACILTAGKCSNNAHCTEANTKCNVTTNSCESTKVPCTDDTVCTEANTQCGDDGFCAPKDSAGSIDKRDAGIDAMHDRMVLIRNHTYNDSESLNIIDFRSVDTLDFLHNCIN